MAVADLVRLFKSFDDSTPYQSSSISNMKLSLETMFHSSRSRTRSNNSTPNSSPSSSLRSPQSAYSRGRFPRPQLPSADLSSLFSPLSASPSSTVRLGVRRQPSRIDIALEEERFAEGPEHLGLGLFEPRPSACTPPPAEPCSLMEFMSESQPSSVALDGIFEVMESS